MREIALSIGIILLVGQFIGGCVVVREYQVPAVPLAVQQYYYSSDPFFGYPGGGPSVDVYISGQTFGVPPTFIPPVGYAVIPQKHYRKYYGKERFILVPVVPVIPLYPYYATRVAPLPRVPPMPRVAPMPRVPPMR